MSNDSHDDSSPDAGPVLSRDAITPRGGFMARPGMKAPPRHAVVVRGGDAPESEHIPVARSSVPPPFSSGGSTLGSSERPTLRAVPKPSSSPPPAVTGAEHDPWTIPAAPALPTFGSELPASSRPPEALPPPSDAPLVANVDDAAPASQRVKPSRWPIVVAAAAGLVLGLLSVVTSFKARGGAARAPVTVLSTAQVMAPRPAALPPAPSASARALPSASSAPERPARPGGSAVKRSIF